MDIVKNRANSGICWKNALSSLTEGCKGLTDYGFFLYI